jgi:D-serine deaminase-like pyridoxal phosphate-dependent protein
MFKFASQTLVRPTLLLDSAKAQGNMARIHEKVKKSGAQLRPHLKTPQSATIAEWFREKGIGAATVSSVQMASYFADHGWDDLLVAFPVNIHEIKAINELASRIRLNLFVISLETASFLEQHLAHSVHVWLEIDNGYARTGIPYQDTEAIASLLRFFESSTKLRFAGFYCHAGDTYRTSPKRTQEIAKETIKALKELKNKALPKFPSLKLMYGDTPSASILEDFEGIDQISAGNFLFYDSMQFDHGNCRAADIAVAMACPIVAVYPERLEAVIHGGAVHFSKDSSTDASGITHYGHLVGLQANSWSEPWPSAYLKSVSQEHGTLKLTAEQLSTLKVGDWIGVLPAHSCLTADLMRSYLTTDGQRIAMMPK